MGITEVVAFHPGVPLHGHPPLCRRPPSGLPPPHRRSPRRTGLAAFAAQHPGHDHPGGDLRCRQLDGSYGQGFALLDPEGLERGFSRWPNCCQAKWSPSTARPPTAPTTAGRGARAARGQRLSGRATAGLGPTEDQHPVQQDHRHPPAAGDVRSRAAGVLQRLSSRLHQDGG